MAEPRETAPLSVRTFPPSAVTIAYPRSKVASGLNDVNARDASFKRCCVRSTCRSNARRKSLAEMNGDYDSLVDRARGIVKGTDPILPKDNWIRLPFSGPRQRDGHAD